MERPTSRASTLFMYLAALAPLGVLLAVLARYGLHFPYSDDFQFAPIADRAAQGVWMWSDYAGVHAGHRLLVAKAILAPVVVFTDWNHTVLIAINVMTGILWFACSLWLTRRWSQAAGTAAAAWRPFAIALLCFTPANAFNYAWGWQIQVFAGVFFISAAIAVLSGRSIGLVRLICAALLAFNATMSFGTGMVAWGGGMIVLAAAPWTQQRVRMLGLWLLLGGATAVFYRFGTGSEGIDSQIVQSNPLKLAAYALTYLGTPVARFRVYLAPWAGAAGLVIFAGMLSHAWRKDRLPLWVLGSAAGLASTSLAAGVITAIGRCHEDYGGIWQAASPRYVAFGTLFWIATAGLAAAMLPHYGTAVRRLLQAGLACACILVVLTGRQGFYDLDEFYKVHEPEARRMVREDLDAVPPRLRVPIMEPLAGELAVMKNRGWSVYRPGVRPYWARPPAPDEAQD